MNDFDLCYNINIELCNFEFKQNSLSYEYLTDAIYIVTKDKSTIKDFKTNVYKPIALKYGTKLQNVQWCLDKLIDMMYLNTSTDKINEYFHNYSNPRISTKRFIIGISRKISIEGFYEGDIKLRKYDLINS